MNERIKQEIKKSRIHNYELAETIGITEYSFSRWFRKELTESQQEQIREAIKQIKESEAQ